MNSIGEDITGRVLILKELKPEYPPEQWPFYARGGFGCSPTTIGTAVVGEFIPDGERCRFEGCQFARLATQQEIEDALIARDQSDSHWLSVVDELPDDILTAND